ncbi:hypothetical protein DV096_12130 [Bradymonadaceae bacterium TMQ3]|nr:hypothetical protein DV096_12130 [Bradymonadaceae bacterium TMQ3]TXC75364.1 hypothetical protein FRC91_11630 [Bradymonadales bacterium TMQ1]
MGSSSVVVSETGGLISREEYRPYGESSFGSYAKKRFRFTGKERDEESGLYYHGARYYSPWLCRWTAPDPAGMVDGVNVYAYVRGNPVRLVDPGGMEGEESQSTCLPVEGSDVDLAIQARDGKGYPNAGYRGLDIPNVAADQVQRDIEQDEFRARSGEVSSREPDIVDVGNSLFEVGVGLGLGGLRGLEEAWNGTLGNPGHHETPESRVREPETPEEELGDALSIFFPMGIRGGGSRGAGGAPIVGRSSRTIASRRAFQGGEEVARDKFAKHREEFPHLNSYEEYWDEANAFLANPPESAIIMYRGGEQGRDLITGVYHPETNRLAFLNSSGEIGSYYKPNQAQHKDSSNLAYFFRIMRN